MSSQEQQQSLLKQMFEAGVHFGHQTKYWNPKMKPYIYGSRNKIHIINLDKTLVLLEDALKFIKQIVKKKGNILFVGTRTQSSELIASYATSAGMPYVDNRWLGGMLTNFETVRKSIKKLEQKSEILEKAEQNGMSKKELLDLSREVQKLTNSIGGISKMKHLPAALFVIDSGCHDIAVKEAQKLGIPVIAIVDTNNDPTKVDYVIPGNDDSAKAISLYLSVVTDTILKTKESTINDLAMQVKMEIVEPNEEEPKKNNVRRIKKTDNEEAETEVEAKTPNATNNIV